MKKLKVPLLLVGLCLVSTLALAAPDSSAALAPTGGEDDVISSGSCGYCSDPASAELSTDAPLSQDCEVKSGWESIEGLASDGGPRSMERKPCKRCPTTPWCECTYQGHPRTTCDPCCYQTYTGEICLS